MTPRDDDILIVAGERVRLLNVDPVPLNLSHSALAQTGLELARPSGGRDARGAPLGEAEVYWAGRGWVERGIKSRVDVLERYGDARAVATGVAWFYFSDGRLYRAEYRAQPL